jgi:hypothetical protein
MRRYGSFDKGHNVRGSSFVVRRSGSAFVVQGLSFKLRRSGLWVSAATIDTAISIKRAKSAETGRILPL